jgi:Gamma-glutamyltransferase
VCGDKTIIFKGLGLGTSEYLHLLIEALKLSFADSLYFISDPEKVHVPVNQLLDKQYANQRRKLISQNM